MQRIDYREVGFLDGFWSAQREKNARVSLASVYRRFSETGRFSALDCVKRDLPPHIFFDSDIAKWLESAAYLLRDYPNKEMEQIVTETVDRIVASQLSCGYFNSYYQVYAPERIFCDRTEHELYCAGHLIEAAVALAETGVNHKLLPAMKKYADYIFERFYVKRDTGFTTCGHPEIELALVRLYEYTKEEKYLTLASFFLDERGVRAEPIYPGRDRTYDQSHKPVREQREAIGHAVRALYLYIAMTDVGRIKHDGGLLNAVNKLFESIVNTKMYLTGGTGSGFEGEWFTAPYDLPNERAYAETCSAIALCMFCQRLFETGDYRVDYDDVFERALYNNVLAGQSLDGKGFFYTNPLEANVTHVRFAKEHKEVSYQPIVERKEVFDCSCCPPNLMRFFGELGGYIYGQENGALFVRQYISSKVSLGTLAFEMRSQMPYGGKVAMKATGEGELRLRIPAWCENYAIEGAALQRKGNVLSLAIKGNAEFTIDFQPRLRFVYANENVSENGGRKAVTYGPMVLCAEGVDNGKNLRNAVINSLDGATIDENGFSVVLPAERLKTGAALYSYEPPARESISLKLIPYFVWANRGETDMQVWFL